MLLPVITVTDHTTASHEASAPLPGSGTTTPPSVKVQLLQVADDVPGKHGAKGD